MTLRLTHLIESGGVTLPGTGQIVVFGPVTAADLSPLPPAQVLAICKTKPEFDLLTAAGFSVAQKAPDHAPLTLVVLPRSKKQARALIARALETSDTTIIDGMKTDGIDSVLREMRKRTDCTQPYSKAHGKIFTATATKGAFDDWAQAGTAQENRDGFTTVAGIFSADGIDPASRLLAAALPVKIKGRVADFGAGWGYLASELLTRPDIKTLDLIEADNAALDCARINVADTRVDFHWADATTWTADKPLDTVVMNPPFHEGRKGVPELGRAFIRNAARNLAPSGRLFMVANRHLPYETALREIFREVDELPGDNRFKLFAASRPSRDAQPRPNR